MSDFVIGLSPIDINIESDISAFVFSAKSNGIKINKIIFFIFVTVVLQVYLLYQMEQK